MISKDTTWTNVKNMLVARSLAAQWVQIDSIYIIAAIDGSFALECRIAIADGTPDPSLNADQIDFETNFKAKGNTRLNTQLDSDNAGFTRVKQAPTGWTYQLRGIEFTTAKSGSVVNLDPMGNQLSDATLEFYDAANAITTDPTQAVKTIMDVEPPNDFYLIGGLSKILVSPVNDVRLSVIAVPDVPASYGGSKVMIQNINFRYVGANDKVDADGRASKMLAYSATQHTNKLRFIVSHTLGEQNSIAVYIEQYKL